jgi:surfeit locus 1 family protein
MPAPDGLRRWLPLIATVAGVTLAVAAGNWQLGRAGEKRELKARFEAQAAMPVVAVPPRELPADEVSLRRVEARGTFVPRYAIYVDNRVHRGEVGYHVVMPLRIAGGEQHILVNRGWIGGHPDRRTLPQVTTPAGEIVVSGVAVVPSERVFELSARVIEGPVWQNLTLERYREAMPIAIQPFVLRQDSALDDGLTREWQAPDFGIEKHYGYAFQWFALAITLLIFYAVSQFRRTRAARA